MTSGRPSATRVLFRGLACRCPVCGTGGLFVRGVESVRLCAACGWRFERCVGHWIGGNEINVVVTFSAGVVTWLACLPFLGLGAASVVVATVVTAIVGVAFYRPSRGLFFALDYLLDPSPDPASGGASGRGPGSGPPRDPSPPTPAPAPAEPAPAPSDPFIAATPSS
jgi:uncharacterized protein (DUF983 family)